MEEKKLSEFLKENGAYESFIDNCLNDEDTLLYVVDYDLSNTGIFSGFTWAETSEGVEYWSKLFDKSCKLDLSYDMDEVLYKEYERRNMKESSEQNPITKDIVENNVESTKQEFQTITLNGIEYNLIPKEISVGYIANWQDKDIKVESYENYDENMQLRIAKKEFEPFTLNIEINTLDEAKSLWNRFNLNYNKLCKALTCSYNVEFENRISTHKYWNQIDDILKDFGEVPDVTG